uniref:Uncharacterized protein n=1 Tax=uncultured delta proteobacterium HF0010_01J10 TaxID=710820 RepID=E0XQC8_9DELT|nr:hypothetical protein [uncultured delta proteobacterium HF0010_01J10]
MVVHGPPSLPRNTPLPDVRPWPTPENLAGDVRCETDTQPVIFLRTAPGRSAGSTSTEWPAV